MKANRTRGFSLIELLIAIVVLSLITTAAVTSYRGSVIKARRADAKAGLLELAQLLERNYTESNSFSTNISGNPYPLAFTVSPRDGTAYYNLQFPGGVVTSPTAQSYILQAVPSGSQQEDTRCMTLTLDEAGTKNNSGPGTVAECW